VAVQAKFYFHDAMQSTVSAPTYTKINAIVDGLGAARADFT
jgi:hypothetical protein